MARAQESEPDPCPPPSNIGTLVGNEYNGVPPSRQDEQLVGPVDLVKTAQVDECGGTVTLPCTRVACGTAWRGVVPGALTIGFFFPLLFVGPGACPAARSHIRRVAADRRRRSRRRDDRLLVRRLRRGPRAQRCPTDQDHHVDNTGGQRVVEPVFGQIDTCQGGKRVLLRRLDAAQAEWALLAACHNLRTLFGHTGTTSLARLAG